MKFSLKKAIAVGLCAGFGVGAYAENPISSYHYLADPSAASDGDTFYILTDTDDMCVSTDPFAYNIVGLYAFSSKDMVNWTDHGMIFQSKREFSYVGNTWASGIAVHNGKIYIVYPDGAGGVGMITSKDIAGPYIDPIALGYNNKYHKIAGHWGDNVLEGCDDIANCFDPGIFIEEDGTGYVIFGGGESDKRPHGNNFDIVKFVENGDAITIDKSSLTRISAPKSFEAPYIHKYKGTYYLSYNNTDQVISYGTSSKITGPYYDKGTFVPSTYGITLYGNKNLGGNNHQGAAEFKGNWYAVYHDRRLVTSPEHPSSLGVANPEPGNHRSVSIDQFTYNADGTIKPVKFTDAGPAQVGKFDPYQTYKALTSSKQRNVRSRTDWTKGQAVKHVLTPLATKESWIRVTGVDFGNGAENLRIKAANIGDNNKVEIRKGSVTGTLAGTCTLAKTSGWQSYTDNDCAMSGLTGVVDQLFFVFKGTKDSTMGILEWEFQGTKREPEPQTPFMGTAAAIPGKIEMENFDIPGVGSGNDSYYDNDEVNHGTSTLRKDTGVDLYAKATGVVVGYIQKDEWLEYTVDVKESGDYTMFAAVASDGGSSFKLSVDGKDITGDVVVPPNEKKEGEEQNFDDYSKVSANVTLTAGKHILRMTATADWFDIDYINFVKGKDAADDSPIEDPTDPSNPEGPSDSEDPNAISMHVNYNSAVQTYKVYNMQGKLLGSVNLNGEQPSKALRIAGFNSGVYMLRNGKGNTIMVNATR